MQTNKITLNVHQESVRIDRFIMKQLPFLSFSAVSQMLRKGNVKLNGKRQKTSCIVKINDIIEIFNCTQCQMTEKIITSQHKRVADLLIQSIVYKNENVLILNKPAGLAVQGGNKVSMSIDDVTNMLKFEMMQKPKLVHRIDRDTSGILVMARNDSAAKELCKMFKEHNAITKQYWALCYGVPFKLSGTISIPLKKMNFDQKEKMSYSADGDTAITHYKVLQHNHTMSLIQFTIVTGRTHQIRAHCAISGIPIIGDRKYNYEYFKLIRSSLPKNFILNSKPVQNIQSECLCLHAEKIEFKLFDNEISATAPLPERFKAILEIFQKSFITF